MKKVFDIKIEDPTLTTHSEQIQRKINKAALIYFVITLPASVIFANNERWFFFPFHHNFVAALLKLHLLYFSLVFLFAPALNFSVIFSIFSHWLIYLYVKSSKKMWFISNFIFRCVAMSKIYSSDLNCLCLLHVCMVKESLCRLWVREKVEAQHSQRNEWKWNERKIVSLWVRNRHKMKLEVNCLPPWYCVWCRLLAFFCTTNKLTYIKYVCTVK